MLEEVLMLGYYSAYGGAIGQAFSQWEEMGFFQYVLPFLLIFAVVFGVLQKLKVFGDSGKGINAIISVVVGLIAVNIEFVPRFFSEIFPQLGVGLAIMLVAVILLEFFFSWTDNEKGKGTWMRFVYMGIGAIIFLVILNNLSYDFGWSGGYWWNEYWPLIIGLAFLVGVIALVVGSGKAQVASRPSGV